MKIPRMASAVAFMLSLIAASQAQARTDHLRCYQVKDPLSLAAVVDLTSARRYFAPPPAPGAVSGDCWNALWQDWQ